MSDDEKQARKEKLFEEHGLDIQHATRNGLALAYGVSQSTLKRAIKLAREGKKGSVQGRPRNGGSPSKQRKYVTMILAAKENGKGFLESGVPLKLLLNFDAKKVHVQVIKFMLIINVHIIHAHVHALVYSLSWLCII